jgi:uncharacterized protein YxeA
MNKNVMIAVVAAVVVVGGGTAYMLTRPDDASTNNNQTSQTDNNQQASEQQKQSEQGSIQSFLAAGNNKRCTYTEGDTSGTIYFASNKRMRMDYQSTGDNPANGSMIVSDTQQHIWDNTTKEGFIMAFKPTEGSSNSTATSQNQAVDVNKSYNFSCESWQVDESKFTPPTDVKFTDLKALTDQFPQN